MIVEVKWRVFIWWCSGSTGGMGNDDSCRSLNSYGVVPMGKLEVGGHSVSWVYDIPGATFLTSRFETKILRGTICSLLPFSLVTNASVEIGPMIYAAMDSSSALLQKV